MPNRAVALSNRFLRTHRTNHRTKLPVRCILSGASWPSTWPFFKHKPSNSNGRLTSSTPLQRTGQQGKPPDNCPVLPSSLPRARQRSTARAYNTHRTDARHRTNVRCALLAHANANREHSITGQRRTGQNSLSGALSGAHCTTQLLLGFATGQRDMSPYMSGALLSGAPSFSVSHAREHSFTGQEPPDKTRLSGALSGALQSTFLNSFLHPSHNH